MTKGIHRKLRPLVDEASVLLYSPIGLWLAQASPVAIAIPWIVFLWPLESAVARAGVFIVALVLLALEMAFLVCVLFDFIYNGSKIMKAVYRACYAIPLSLGLGGASWLFLPIFLSSSSPMDCVPAAIMFLLAGAVWHAITHGQADNKTLRCLTLGELKVHLGQAPDGDAPRTRFGAIDRRLEYAHSLHQAVPEGKRSITMGEADEIGRRIRNAVAAVAAFHDRNGTATLVDEAKNHPAASDIYEDGHRRLEGDIDAAVREIESCLSAYEHAVALMDVSVYDAGTMPSCQDMTVELEALTREIPMYRIRDEVSI